MAHTLEMRSWRLRKGILLVVLAVASTAGWAQDMHWQRAVDRAVSKAPEARVVVLEIGSGKLLASAHLAEASRTLAAPGSTLKPLILYFALESGRWDPQRRVACSRRMRIGSHQLNCSHPETDPLDAEQALAWSCNSYFAAMAASLTAEELSEALSERNLLAATGLRDGESLAEFRLPRSREQIQLAALGVEGIRVTLPEMAEAYRSLAIELAAHPQSMAARTVRAGLSASASFGMADAAALGGVPVAGKTGTASAESGGATHGWFAGLVPAESPRIVLAVYVPTGHGSDAAQIAANILTHSPLRKP